MSCCETIWVPGGRYLMGEGVVESTEQAFERVVGGFYLDRFEVTVGRFNTFLGEFALPEAGAGAHPRIPGSGWRTEFENVPEGVPRNMEEARAHVTTRCAEVGVPTFTDGNQQLPVNCVNWYLAFAFCAYDGGRLPTEAEWNYAAVGGVSGLPYPWSESVADTSIDPTRAAYNNFNDPVPELPPAVGTHPAGQGRFARYAGKGHEDLAGSLAEWVVDGWDESPSPSCKADCMTAWDDIELLRVIRGGAYLVGYEFLRTGRRTEATASNIAQIFGFRCARDALTSSE